MKQLSLFDILLVDDPAPTQGYCQVFASPSAIEAFERFASGAGLVVLMK